MPHAVRAESNLPTTKLHVKQWCFFTVYDPLAGVSIRWTGPLDRDYWTGLMNNVIISR